MASQHRSSTERPGRGREVGASLPLPHALLPISPFLMQGVLTRPIALYATIWVSAVLALSLAALAFHAPGFMDAYYYYHVASNLAAGRGLVEDVVWNYLAPPPAISHPSNLYWMPLPSLVAAAGLVLFGDQFRAAQAPMILLSSLVPLAAGVLAHRLLKNRFKAAAAAAITLFAGYYFVYWLAVDSFALYTLAAGVVFVATGALLPRGWDGRSAALALLIGLGAALAHLSRADGPLLLVAALLVVLWRPAPGTAVTRWRMAALAIASYLCCMAPWFLRNIVIAGTPLPGGGLQTMFLRDYNEIFSYGLALGPDWYFAQGLSEIVMSKLTAALRNLGVLFGLEYWLAPFAVVGWWSQRRSPFFAAPLVYGVLLYAAMTLLFTYPSGRGSMLHSGVALLPWLAITAVEGVERATWWASRYLRHWNPPVGSRNFTLVFIVCSMVLCGYLVYDQARTWEEQVDGYRGVAPLLGTSEQQPVVMALNPPGWWYVTRIPSIQTPSNGRDAALAAAHRYGATHLILEPARTKDWQDFDDATGDSCFVFSGEQRGYKVYRIVLTARC